MDRDIPLTSWNSDRKVTEPVRITTKTILAVHFKGSIDRHHVNIKLEQISKLKLCIS